MLPSLVIPALLFLLGHNAAATANGWAEHRGLDSTVNTQQHHKRAGGKLYDVGVVHQPEEPCPAGEVLADVYCLHAAGRSRLYKIHCKPRLFPNSPPPINSIPNLAAMEGSTVQGRCPARKLCHGHGPPNPAGRPSTSQNRVRAKVECRPSKSKRMYNRWHTRADSDEERDRDGDGRGGGRLPEDADEAAGGGEINDADRQDWGRDLTLFWSPGSF